MPTNDHFEQLQTWLSMESEAEKDRFDRRQRGGKRSDAEKSGETLLDLAISDTEAGLAGQTLLTLVKRNRTVPMPWHRLRVGSPVILSTEDDREESRQGVVSGVRRELIQISVGDWPEGNRFRLDLSADDITRRRQAAALQAIEQATGRVAHLREVLLGEKDPKFSAPAELRFATTLNQSQQEAVQFALAAHDLAIIHGPPGTGKTTTVVELIAQAIERGQKVLACAPSNTAVDNLLERLVAAGKRVVRIGHPARVDERLREYTLDAQANRQEEIKIVRDMLREAEALYRKIDRYTRAPPPPGARKEMRREAQQLKADARMLEQHAVKSVLDKADVICATTTFNEELLGDRRFDLAVVDEACQCTEPAAWTPLLRAERIVLAGDHCQLPPTVLSSQAAREGFNVSLLERLVALYGDSVTRQLRVQYRMHTQIMAFSSDQFYGGSLEAHESVASHTLHDLESVDAAAITADAVSFIDTAGADWTEEIEPDGESKRNPQEAEYILRRARELIEAGLSASEIAVIAPYAAQVRWLRSAWEGNDLEIDTVDGFQGREKEAVLITCVRSNANGEIGFLGDTRRMNVALTRARRKLIVIGDSATLGGNDFYANMLSYFESIGAYRSIWEEDLEL